MRQKLAVDDICALGEREATKLAWSACGPYTNSCRWQEAQALLHHSVEQLQMVELFNRRGIAMQRSIELIKQIGIHLRMLAEQEDCPCQRISGSLVASDEQGEGVTDQLVVA